jgi:hypothetical protein
MAESAKGDVREQKYLRAGVNSFPSKEMRGMVEKPSLKSFLGNFPIETARKDGQPSEA